MGIFDWPITKGKLKSSFEQSQNRYIVFSSFGLPIQLFPSKTLGQRIWEKMSSYWEHVGGHVGTWGT
jgi:hypothetical protein